MLDQQCFNLRSAEACRNRLFFGYLTLGITGIGTLPQFCRGQVTLVRIQQVLGKLGCFAQTDRQQAGRQRIQRPGVAGLGGTIDSFDPLQGSIGR